VTKLKQFACEIIVTAADRQLIATGTEATRKFVACL
jgi:hypothetical protein